MEDIVVQLVKYWKPFEFQAFVHSLCISTSVDNIFSASSILEGAIAIIEDFASYLASNWLMIIKASSRSCFVAAGSSEIPLDPARWPLVEQFCVLGHTLLNTGSIRACLKKTKAGMWRAFCEPSVWSCAVS